MKRVKQHHRIHSTGDGHEYFLAAHQETPLIHGIFDVLQEFAHAAILPIFGARGKQPDYGASISR
jgi:hypothetical protein